MCQAASLRTLIYTQFSKHRITQCVNPSSRSGQFLVNSHTQGSDGRRTSLSFLVLRH